MLHLLVVVTNGSFIYLFYLLLNRTQCTKKYKHTDTNGSRSHPVRKPVIKHANSMLCCVQETYRQDIGHGRLIHSDKKDVLMHRWRYPSLSLHGL